MADPPPYHYDDAQKLHMLRHARQVMTTALYGQPPRLPDVEAADPYLREPRGCFVSLHHRHGHLRGCIGTFETTIPLIHSLTRMSVAALRDPRFIWSNPVVLAEVNDVHIEVSVLTPMQPLEDPLSLRLGIDGIVIRGQREGKPLSGCFLPHVPLEAKWNVEQTLSMCCAHKMGLPEDAWRAASGELTYFRFQAAVFSEAKPGVLATHA